jgi:chorismate mutase
VSVIAQVKKDKSLAAHQPERYKAMLERLQAKAAKMSLDEQLVKEFWDAVHAASLRQQKRVIDLS